MKAHQLFLFWYFKSIIGFYLLFYIIKKCPLYCNEQGLQKTKGSSQFKYTDASGSIVIGYAGESKNTQINNKLGLEVGGISTLGTENTIISQALESSNSSITEALPELTVAQKTFTSNTKVVSVGNTIVDDLNGLIR